MNVLIVEDESIVALDIAGTLEEAGYRVTGIADSYDEAMQLLKQQPVDIMICDINLGNGPSGIDLVKSIKEHQNIQTVFLTAFTDDDTLNDAIETDPCGYLAKPFKREDLSALMKLAARRLHAQASALPIDLGNNYCYDPDNELLSHNAEPVTLTKTEQSLMALLIKQCGKTLYFQEMEYHIWPHKAVNDGTRRTLVYRLNHKVGHRMIETIPGVGYRLAAFPIT